MNDRLEDGFWNDLSQLWIMEPTPLRGTGFFSVKLLVYKNWNGITTLIWVTVWIMAIIKGRWPFFFPSVLQHKIKQVLQVAEVLQFFRYSARFYAICKYLEYISWIRCVYLVCLECDVCGNSILSVADDFLNSFNLKNFEGPAYLRTVSGNVNSLKMFIGTNN